VLIISRKVGEQVMIGDDVVVTVVDVGGQTARIGIDAPRSIPVYRAELWAAVRDENRAAAEDGVTVLPPVE